jgi:RNA polymerase sigma-70 factor (ECF subfamily)
MWLFAALAAVGDTAGAEADRLIVRRMAGGDHLALGELYDRHARLLYSLALRIVRERSDAEDVLQETFSQVWRQANRFEASRGTVVGWLVTVTRSRALDRLRQRRTQREGAADFDRVADSLPDRSRALDLQLVTAEQANRVRAALAALPDELRIPLELAYYEGLSQSEIAERLRTPLGTIKTRMRQTLLRLREALAGAMS